MQSDYYFWLDGEHGGRFSYIGYGQPSVPDLTRRQEPDKSLPFPFQGGWVGFCTYEKAPFFIEAQRWMAIDHLTGQCWNFGFDRRETPEDGGTTGMLRFFQPKEEYLANIAKCLEAIRAGESYEVCLTNELRGRSTMDPLAYFEALRCLNPAPFAAFIRTPDVTIACSSPELFLDISAEGHVVSKPIKGTAPRDSDPSQLAADEKTRAENLMIVDLVRNDLGRVCRTGSVKVTGFQQIETFATVHHMVSTIEGDLKPGLTGFDCIDAAFPPGSMTGAPKIRTMEIIHRLEARPRGIYSGCIGFCSRTGAATFNVAIRTAVFANGEVSIGTGGAIVAQSDPEREWEEINLKAEALVRAFK